MDFSWTEEQQLLRNTVRKVMEKLGDQYWLEKEQKQEFPNEFWEAISAAGFLGTVIPEKYGGAGLGAMEFAIIMEEIATAVGPGPGIVTALSSIFGSDAIICHGSEDQKGKYLPGLASGKIKACMALTEPNAGSNTLATETRAVDKGDYFVINGAKQFITGVQYADIMLAITRSTPLDQVNKKTEGLTLFMIDNPAHDPAIEFRPINKMAFNYMHTNQVWFNDLKVPKENVLGRIGRGWYHILDILNSERIVAAAISLGGGQHALNIAVQYAKERKVFDRLIGQNQGIQFPLADAKIKLEAAKTMIYKAASLFDQGLPCGFESNMAKYLSSEYGFAACDVAMQTLGGYSYAKEYYLERIWRETRLYKIAPITNEMILNYVGQSILGLPRSY